jgi:hypothetical protein
MLLLLIKIRFFPRIRLLLYFFASSKFFVLVLLMCIRDVVTQALTTGLLTLEAEDQLRTLMTNKYGYDDLQAFMTLQSAAMIGQVEQESRMQNSSVRSPRLATYCNLP